MTTQEAELFQAHPLYQYVKQIATVVLQVRTQLRSNEVKLDTLKMEWDKMRVDMQAFLERINGPREDSQSLLDNSLLLSGETGKVNVQSFTYRKICVRLITIANFN